MSEYEEILDVVNSEDRIIGKASRLQVHNNDLMHRSAHILVFNSIGSLFLQMRSMNKDESPGLWDSSAAGHVESGEHYFSCAKRELKEELSLSSVKLDEVLSIPAQSMTLWEHVRVYKCVTDANICINKNEVSEGNYMKLSQISALMQLKPGLHTSTFSYIYDNYIKKLVRPYHSIFS